MKILHVNKFLYRRGGAEAYLFDLAAMQESQGHEVAFFSTAHPENVESSFSSHFPRYFELNPPPGGLLDKVRAAAHIFYSFEAAKGMGRVIDAFRPDVVHVHNIYHHLSPSVFRPARAAGVPVVMTLHDFKLVCPTHSLLARGRPCEACVGRRFHRALQVRCADGSLGVSTLNAVELTLHTLFGAYEPVCAFACPSRFLLNMMRRGGVFPERLHHVPNFIDAATMQAKQAPGGGIVYVGRLSPEKGVDVLVRAAARLESTVDIVGDGPERQRLEALADSLGAPVRFQGHQPPSRAHALLRSAAVSVVPSRGYENMPMAILESFALGVPVVGTAHGGVPELIEPGTDGQLVLPGDHQALAAALRGLVARPDDAFEMGRAGRRKVLEAHSPSRHLGLVTSLYRRAGVAGGD